MAGKVVGIGEILWDILPGGKVLGGGAPANFAYHVSQFGLEGYAVSAVGDDPAGREILATLSGKGLRYIMETVRQPTGTVRVTLDSEGVPVYEISENVAWDNMVFTEETARLARECSAVCFGTLAQRSPVSRRVIQKFVDTVPDRCLRVFDVNLRQGYYDREIIAASLGRCDILKINEEETSVVAGTLGWDGLSGQDVCRRLIGDYGLDIVIETRGAEGSRVLSSGEESVLPTPRVEVVDTVGAGDSFTGAFTAALLAGKPLREAHRRAVEVSAWVCTRHGAMPSHPGL